MKSLLGNDVVDLGSPHVRGKSSQLRFVKKILTNTEQTALNDFSNPDTALWLHWAGKESAYKALSRIDPHVSSSPQKYRVSWFSPHITQSLQGVVHTPSGAIPVTAWCNDEFVCCLCYQFFFPTILGFGQAELPAGTVPDYSRTMDEQSLLVRKSAIDSLSSFLDCPPDVITIKKSEGVRGLPGPPCVWINGHQTDILLSLSHDGRFVCFVWGIEYKLDKTVWQEVSS